MPKLTLIHEGSHGYRHYLDDQAVEAGSVLEVRLDDEWVECRYEWSFDPSRQAYLVLEDDRTINIEDDTEVRWP